MGQVSLFDDPAVAGCKRVHLDDARNDLLEAARNGARCPCCDGWAQVYKRSIYDGPAKFLVWLVREWNGLTMTKRVGRYAWFNKHDYPGTLQNGDYGRLPQWGLTVRKCNDDDPKKKASALWQPTDNGIEFVAHKLAVPRSLLVFQNRVLEKSDELVCIRQALKDDFDVRQIMATARLDEVRGKCEVCR